MRHFATTCNVATVVPLLVLVLVHSTGALLLPTAITPAAPTRAARLSPTAATSSALRMANTSPPANAPRGSGPSDTISREGFIAGSVGLVAAALSPGFLTEPTPPPSYDVSKYERIYDTARRSFVPANPSRLILPGAGFTDRVIVAGEMHTHPLHHRMQFEVIKAVASVTKPKREPLAIGLEMFYRQQQVSEKKFASFAVLFSCCCCCCLVALFRAGFFLGVDNLRKTDQASLALWVAVMWSSATEGG